jgi:hypothetical protein
MIPNLSKWVVNHNFIFYFYLYLFIYLFVAIALWSKEEKRRKGVIINGKKPFIALTALKFSHVYLFIFIGVYDHG